MLRKTIVALTSKLTPCIIAMEACCGAHHLGRVLSAQGHTVRLMSPEYVRPYVKAQKNDDRDPEAIAEAATRPTMRFVALKSEQQLDMQTLHRARDRAVGERTSLMNQLRAVLLERGVIVPQGRAKLRLRVTELLQQSPEQISSRIRLLIEDMLMRWQALDEWIAGFDGEFAAELKRDEAARRLTSIPGIGASMQLPLSLRSVTRRPLRAAAISPPGLGLSLGRRRRGASRGYSASPNAVANICARC